MKTHELAKYLTQLAGALKAGPNIDLKQLRDLLSSNHAMPDPAQVAVNVTTLLALSRLSKSEWREIVKAWGLPIEIPTAYSARDTIGKVLNYLEKHPEAVDSLQRQTGGKSAASAELMKALSVLMSGRQR